MTVTHDMTPLLQAQAQLSAKIAAAVEHGARVELELGELHEIISNADGRGVSGSFADRLRELISVQWSPGNAQSWCWWSTTAATQSRLAPAH